MKKIFALFIIALFFIAVNSYNAKSLWCRAEDDCGDIPPPPPPPPSEPDPQGTCSCAVTWCSSDSSFTCGVAANNCASGFTPTCNSPQSLSCVECVPTGAPPPELVKGCDNCNYNNYKIDDTVYFDAYTTYLSPPAGYECYNGYGCFYTGCTCVAACGYEAHLCCSGNTCPNGANLYCSSGYCCQTGWYWSSSLNRCVEGGDECTAQNVCSGQICNVAISNPFYYYGYDNYYQATNRYACCSNILIYGEYVDYFVPITVY